MVIPLNISGVKSNKTMIIKNIQIALLPHYIAVSRPTDKKMDFPFVNSIGPIVCVSRFL